MNEPPAGYKQNRIRVLHADDHPLIRRGIAATLAGEEDIELVGDAADGLSLHMMFRHHLPDVVLLDLHMPKLSPFEDILRLRSVKADIKVLALTAFEDVDHVRQVIAAQADGYLLKEVAIDEVGRAIRTVMKGGKWFNAATLSKLATTEPDRASLNQMAVLLSERERFLLKHLAQGLSDHEIAEIMSISDRTVRNYVRTLFDKLGVETRVAAAVKSVQLGLIDSI